MRIFFIFVILFIGCETDRNVSIQLAHQSLRDPDVLFLDVRTRQDFINEGKEVYLVELEDKDPSELGFNHFTHLIQSTSPLSFSDLLEKKIQLI